MENPPELISLDNFEVNSSSRSQYQTNSNQPTSLLNIQQFNSSNLNQSNSLSQNNNQTNRPLAGNNKYFISRRNQRVQQNYPTVYVIFHSVFVLACGLTLISGEIIASNKINNWNIFSDQIAGGIFSGSLIIFGFFLTLITISFKNAIMLVIVVIINLIAPVVSIIFVFIFQNLPNDHKGCILKPDDCESNKIYILGLIFVFNIIFLSLNSVVFSIIILFKVVFEFLRNHQKQVNRASYMRIRN